MFQTDTSASETVKDTAAAAAHTFWKWRSVLSGSSGSEAAPGAPRYSCGVSQPLAAPALRATLKETVRPLTCRPE